MSNPENRFDELLGDGVVFPKFRTGNRFDAGTFDIPPVQEIESADSVEDNIHETTIDTRYQAIGLFMEERVHIQDTRLLDTKGIIVVAKELGVSFDGQILADNSINDFCEACEKLDNEKSALGQALIVIAVGQLCIERGGVPEYVYNMHQHAIQMYLGSLDLVDNWLDANKGGQTEPPAERLREYFERQWRDDWTEAVAAAVAFEDSVIHAVKTDRGEEILMGEEADTSLQLHDAQGNKIGNYSSFILRSRTFADDAKLLERKIPRRGAGPATSGETRTLRDGFFPKKEYPDQAVVDAATVEHIASIVPVHPDEQKVLFRLVIDSKQPQQRLQIITGERCHTEAGRELHTSEKTGLVSFGLPNAFGGGGEEFFSATTTKAIGTKRQKTAKEVGDEASKSVVIVLKPTVTPARASFRTQFLLWRRNGMNDEKFAEAILDSSDADTVPELLAMNRIDPAEQARLTIAMESKTQERKELERQRLIARTKISHEDLEPTLNSPGAFESKGSKGSSHFPASFSDATVRGGKHSFAMSAIGLHTGSSGIDTGGRFGQLKSPRTVDPFSSPHIIVIHPYGVTGKEEMDISMQLAGSLMNN